MDAGALDAQKAEVKAAVRDEWAATIAAEQETAAKQRIAEEQAAAAAEAVRRAAEQAEVGAKRTAERGAAVKLAAHQRTAAKRSKNAAAVEVGTEVDHGSYKRVKKAVVRAEVDHGSYKCVKKAVVRAEVGLTSDKVGRLKPGDVFKALEVRAVEGQLRVRGEMGWASVRSTAGNNLLEKVSAEENGATTSLPEKAEEQPITAPSSPAVPRSLGEAKAQAGVETAPEVSKHTAEVKAAADTAKAADDKAAADAAAVKRAADQKAAADTAAAAKAAEVKAAAEAAAARAASAKATADAAVAKQAAAAKAAAAEAKEAAGILEKEASELKPAPGDEDKESNADAATDESAIDESDEFGDGGIDWGSVDFDAACSPMH